MTQDSHLLTDIRLRLRHYQLRPVYSVDLVERRIPTQPSRLTDYATISGVHNLGQAIVLRLLTPLGELAALGHPEYGSRLHQMIGALNNETNRNLIKLHILEALDREPRIEKVLTLRVTPDPDPGRRESVNVFMEVKPVGYSEVVAIGPFVLELEQ